MAKLRLLLFMHGIQQLLALPHGTTTMTIPTVATSASTTTLHTAAGSAHTQPVPLSDVTRSLAAAAAVQGASKEIENGEIRNAAVSVASEASAALAAEFAAGLCTAVSAPFGPIGQLSSGLICGAFAHQSVRDSVNTMKRSRDETPDVEDDPVIVSDFDVAGFNSWTDSLSPAPPMLKRDHSLSVPSTANSPGAKQMKLEPHTGDLRSWTLGREQSIPSLPRYRSLSTDSSFRDISLPGLSREASLSRDLSSLSSPRDLSRDLSETGPGPQAQTPAKIVFAPTTPHANPDANLRTGCEGPSCDIAKIEGTLGVPNTADRPANGKVPERVQDAVAAVTDAVGEIRKRWAVLHQVAGEDQISLEVLERLVAHSLSLNQETPLRKRKKRSPWQTDKEKAAKLRAAVWEVRFYQKFTNSDQPVKKADVSKRYDIPKRTLTRYIKHSATGSSINSDDENENVVDGVRFKGEQDGVVPPPPRLVQKYRRGFTSDRWETATPDILATLNRKKTGLILNLQS